MNEEIESFEKRLKRMPLRQVPAEWREEILSAAAKAHSVPRAAAVSGNSFLSGLNRRLAAILWPHPVAWGALAAIWILIFAMNFSVRDKTPVVAEQSNVPPPEMVAELQAQRRLYAELIGSSQNDSSDVDRQKRFVPRPRSERTWLLTA